MIDSICPKAFQNRTQNIVPHGLFTSYRCKPEINFLISNQLKASAKMVEDWIMPSWSSRPYFTFASRNWIGNTGIDQFRGGSSIVGSVSPHGWASPSSRDTRRGSSTTGFTFYSDDDIVDNPKPAPSIKNNEDESDCDVKSDLPSLPRTILLRCHEYVPVSRSNNPEAISKVDVVRDYRLLGWDEYNSNLVQCVIDVPGHHFNLFAEENVSSAAQMSITISRG